MLPIVLIIGVCLASTILWLGAVYFYLNARFGADSFLALDLGGLAMVVASTMAPVLIVWLIAGFFGVMVSLRQQGQVIRQLLWQVRRSVEHTDVTTKILIERRQLSHGNAFFFTFRDARDELNGALASLVVKAGLCSIEDIDTLWTRYDCGDRSVFSHLLRDMAERDDGFSSILGRMMATTPRMRADAMFFLTRYERLVRLGSEWDEQRYILDLVQDGDLGFAQRLVFKAVYSTFSTQPEQASPQPKKGLEPDPDSDIDLSRSVRVWPKSFPPEDSLLEGVQGDPAFVLEVQPEDNEQPAQSAHINPHAGLSRLFTPHSPDLLKKIPRPEE